ncbi:MAG: fatty acid desaturase [Phycisphaeraceae bacterium]
MTTQTPPVRESKELLLATKKYAHENRLQSWWHLWSTLGIFAALTFLICLDFAWPWRMLLGILSGLVLVRLFIIYHDYQHGTLLRRSRIAAAIMSFYGLITLNPPSIWNRSHEHHHRNNAKIYGADIGSYPVMTVEDYAKANRSKRLQYAVSRHPLTIALGYFTVFLYGMCIRSLIVNPRLHKDSAIALVVHVTMLVLLGIFVPDVLLFAAVIPFMVAAGAGAYLFYAQHNFPGVELRNRAEWDYVFAAMRSSSYIKMNRVMAWFTGNIGYHHIHHLNARIPFYRLPEAMAEMPELQDPLTTSLHPRDIAHCLRLKLWDPDRNQLVPFPSSADAAAQPSD